METTTANQFTNDIAPLPERPQFLKVLCILTWVCSGLMLLNTLAGMIMKPSEEQKMEQIEKMREINPEGAAQMEIALNSQSGGQHILNSILTVIALLLSAAGAMWMWNLKKTGFYIYLAGEALPYVSFFLGGAAAMQAVASMAGSMGNAIVGAVIGIMVVFDIAFIIMYAVNLKHMNK